MKKRIIIFLFFASQINFAQNTFPINGNVGIGTLVPTQALDVNGNGIFKGGITSEISGSIGGYLTIANPSKISNGIAQRWTIFNMSGGYGNSLQFWAYDNLGCGTGLCNNRFTIMDNGNVGIGTINPSSKLEITESSLAGYEIGSFKLKSATSNQFMYFGYDDRYSAGYIQSVKPGTGQQNILLAPVGGNIGIGTTSPDEKLTVKGKIHTQEVRVDMAGPLVPDYVFANDYKLKTLLEVEAYIKENSHLPEVPSAKEIEKNGLMLAEMNMLLLKKMEEMTLYMIEMKKESEEMKGEILKLKQLNK